MNILNTSIAYIADKYEQALYPNSPAFLWHSYKKKIKA